MLKILFVLLLILSIVGTIFYEIRYLMTHNLVYRIVSSLCVFVTIIFVVLLLII